MALYRWSTKLAGIGNWFNPSNAGSTDQILTKTAWWYEWQDPSGSDYSWVTKTIDLPSYQPMQWPCDEWFHIPTKDNWDNVISIWETLWIWSSSNWDWLKTYLKMPLAWYRNSTDW